MPLFSSVTTFKTRISNNIFDHLDNSIKKTLTSKKGFNEKMDTVHIPELENLKGTVNSALEEAIDWNAFEQAYKKTRRFNKW